MLGSLPDAASIPLLVVVADNLPDEGRAEEVVAGAGGTYLPMRSNLGYGGAINAAVRSLPQGIDWVMITNPDVVFHPGAIDRMLEVGTTSADIGAVGPARPERGRVGVSVGARGPGHPRRFRARALRERLADESVDPALPRRSVAGHAPATPAGCPARASSCAARRSRASADSTRATSCTSRTSTSAFGSAGRGGATASRRPPRSRTPAVTRPRASRLR